MKFSHVSFSLSAVVLFWVMSKLWDQTKIMALHELQAGSMTSDFTNNLIRNVDSTAHRAESEGRIKTGSGRKVEPESEFVVDILCIGSQTRLNLLEAQRQSFASHVSVRHFFMRLKLMTLIHSVHPISP